MKIALILLAAAFVVQGCANRPCRELRNPELAGATSSGATSAGGSAVTDQKKSDRIFVAKPDGSLQCGQGRPIKIEIMEAELKGIQVFSRKNENDGKMRIQLCGSPTGNMNIYEIPASSLAEAEKRGFKKI